MNGFHVGLELGIFIALIAVIILAFEVWMFFDAVTNPRLQSTERLLWCIGMLILHPFVALFYYFTVYSGRQ